METLARPRPLDYDCLIAPTPAPMSCWRHALIRVTTRHATEFVDITEQLDALVAISGIRARLINVQALHTTVGIVVNEHEPLLLTDFESTLHKVAPIDVRYRHDDLSIRTRNLTPNERVNGHAHCRALLLTTSACLNAVDGRLLLGQWQRVFLVELDGPRERIVSVMILGEAADQAPGLSVVTRDDSGRD